MIPERVEISAGDLIDGKYTVVKEIGSGSYGDVFKVRDARGDDYALKVLHLFDVPGEFRDELVRRFEQEFKASRIDSRFLVHSLGYGFVRGNPYLLMEFCPNGDLDSMGQKDKRSVAAVAGDILRGLYVLHSEGMVHRDLKPGNVLLRADGSAALADFGSVGFRDVKLQSSKKLFSTRPRDMKGTPIYMSPEVFDRRGGGVTYLPTVDIWSFGVMMYELVTDGGLPFGNIENIEELPKYQERAKKGDWDRDRLRAAHGGREWLDIIDSCLAPNYRERYQNAGEVLRDLNWMMGEASLSSRHSGEVDSAEFLSRSTALTRLVITQGENIGSSYTLRSLLNGGGRMLRVGREGSNDIVLPDNDNAFVSRFHFTLERSKDERFWTIRDGQWQRDARRWVISTNGTYLNATPVSSEGLKVFTGDIITAGEYKIKVE